MPAIECNYDCVGNGDPTTCGNLFKIQVFSTSFTPTHCRQKWDGTLNQQIIPSSWNGGVTATSFALSGAPNAPTTACQDWNDADISGLDADFPSHTPARGSILISPI